MENSEGFQTEPANRMQLLDGSMDDGNVSVTFSEDKLTLKGDFYPPSPIGQPLKIEQIAEALDKAGIIFGILWENIQDAITDCNLNHAIMRDIAMVRGNPPVTEILEYYQMNPKLKSGSKRVKDNEQLDYRSLSPFVIVKKDQALAKRRPHKEGQIGVNIYGEDIPYDTITPQGVCAGENTRSDDAFIYSAIHGQLIEDKGILNVQDKLVIKGAIDYHTGHINFPGDIQIDGPVSDGFKIFSGGSVTIKQTFDVTEAIIKTDLIVKGGIIGRGKALLKVGGELKTKFLENCKAACRKTVAVEFEIIKSLVYTMEKVEMSEKGKILGSEIYAVKGLRAGNIGKKTGKASRIHCGVDFTALQEQEKYNGELRIIAAKLKTIRNLLNNIKTEVPNLTENSPEDMLRKKMEKMRAQLEERQKLFSSKASAVFARVYADESAEIIATGEIAAGTLIEICKTTLSITEPLKRVRICLDRSMNKLVVKPLTLEQ